MNRLTVPYLDSLPLGSAAREYANEYVNPHDEGEPRMVRLSDNEFRAFYPPRVLVTGATCSNCDLPLDGRTTGGRFPFVATFSEVEDWSYDHKSCGGEHTVHITMEPIGAEMSEEENDG